MADQKACRFEVAGVIGHTTPAAASSKQKQRESHGVGNNETDFRRLAGACYVVPHGVRLQFQLVQPMLDDIANADDADESRAFCHRHMAYAPICHRFRYLGDGVARRAGHNRLDHQIGSCAP